MNRSFQPKGQGVVEYILITALVSLAAVTIFRAFRDDIAQAYQAAGDALVASVSDPGSTGTVQP